MAIYKGTKQITDLHHGTTAMYAVYYGLKVIWKKAVEYISFLDKNGNPFYSKDGIPLQGKQ